MNPRVEFKVDVREPFANGAEFGESGSYERIAGQVHFAIDPDAPENRSIVDLERVERNADGLVEYSTDFYILRPVDLAKGNGRLIYDVNNRGNMRLLQFMNDAVHSNTPSEIEHAGNGFLLRRGYSIVWSGWQGDLLPGDGRLTMQLPVPTNDGAPLTGLTRSEFVADEPGITNIPLSANDFTRSYPAASTSTDEATLTMRAYETDDRIVIPADQWSFARIDESGQEVASNKHLLYPDGFRSGWIYELVYTAQDPEVMGLGFTGVRDLISFLLHEATDDTGRANPLRDSESGIEMAYAWGRSQSGRFLREFVYQGFNEDGQGRQVFAGISPHVSGGGRVWMNCRFAQPGRFPRQHNDHLYPSDQFPFAYAETTDPHTGRDRRDPEASGDRSICHPHSDGVRILGPQWVTRPHGLRRERLARSSALASVSFREFTAQRRSVTRKRRGLLASGSYKWASGGSDDPSYEPAQYLSAPTGPARRPRRLGLTRPGTAAERCATQS